MPLDLPALWDFANPALSEKRFRAALPAASPDDQLILLTQIARTHGLRRDFSTARQLLTDLVPQIATASPEARIRYHLELGRTYSSMTHTPESQSLEAITHARINWQTAITLARSANLDALTIDAIHMMATLDTAPADQHKWGLEALRVVESSSQPGARLWEASIRNNIGYALHLLARNEEALAEFKTALALRQKQGNPANIRIAHWMIARVLRDLGRCHEALTIQLQLEQEWQQEHSPSAHVFEELEALYLVLGDPQNAARYAKLRNAL